MSGPRNAMEVRPGYRGRAFTSDLTGQEFWLVIDKGFQPMGLVLGNCVYSMGAVRNWLVGIKSNFQGEIKEYSELMYQARRRHKTTSTLLHELGHNLGAPHTTEPDTIMDAIYSDHAASFDPHSRERILATLDARLHRARAAPAKPEAHPTLSIRVTESAQLVVGGNVIDLATLDELLELSFKDDADTAVLVKASSKAPHDAIMGVLEHAKAAGLRRMAIAADDPP